MAQDTRNYRAKQVIFREAETADHAFLIRAGSVAILKQTNAGPVTLATIGKNAIFGEMALVDGSLRMASAVAIEENTSCALISKDQLRQKLAQLSLRGRGFFEKSMTFVRETLPWTDRVKNPALASESDQDKAIRALVAASGAEVLTELMSDPFLMALYKILINYVQRRLPVAAPAQPRDDSDPMSSLFSSNP